MVFRGVDSYFSLRTLSHGQDVVDSRGRSRVSQQPLKQHLER